MTELIGEGLPGSPSPSSETLAGVLHGGGAGDVAVVVAETSGAITFERLRQNVHSLAAALQEAGVRRGDRVALVLSGGHEFVQSVLAITQLGAAVAPLNPAFTRPEFTFFLRDLAPQLLLLPKGKHQLARGAVSPDVLVAELGSDDGFRVALTGPDRRERSRGQLHDAVGEDVALLLHTSGTTSRPKLVPLEHRNLMASINAIRDHYALSVHDVTYCPMPLFHVHGLIAGALAPLAAGGSVVLPKRFSVSNFWACLTRDRVTWFSAAPTLHRMILDKRPHDAHAGGVLRFIRSCSASLPGDLFARMEEEYGAPVLQAYGMTEASHQIASNPLPPQTRSFETVGIPSGTEVAIMDERGAVLPTGEIGEVAIRGPNVTRGYLDNPDANAEAFVNGWFRTGDRGGFDTRSHLRLEGRIKELIIRGGENISPSEIEEVLLRHPAVADAVCFGVPDPKYGETVGAAVVIQGDIDKEELVRHCAEYLSSAKLPSVVRFVDHVPRTATGKPRRREAAASLGERDSD